MPRACIWDYVSVMYRDPRAPLDPREWALRNRWLYPPWRLAGDIRSGRWKRTAPLGRAALAAGAAAYAAVALGLLAFILMMLITATVLTGSTPFARWRLPGRGGMALLMGVYLLLTIGWPTAWMGWIAAGGPDRGTAVLRRRRVGVAHQPGGNGRIAARRVHWGEVIARWPRRPFNRTRHWVDPMFALACMLVGAAWLVLMVLFAPRAGMRPVAGFYVVLMVVLVWGRRRRASLQRRLLDAVACSACPDCRYSMLELPGRPGGPDAARWPGPARCPECGSPWPLVPPPVPGES